jgi:uncharacterized protein (TIGR02611 family)
MSSTPPRRRLHELPAPLRAVLRHARRVVIAVVGTSVVLIGLIMALPGVPGPGIVVIPLGLAILAIEFVWARRLLRYVRRRIDELVRRDAARADRFAGSGVGRSSSTAQGDPPWSPT